MPVLVGRDSEIAFSILPAKVLSQYPKMIPRTDQALEYQVQVQCPA
jgi:hypothetical protein